MKNLLIILAVLFSGIIQAQEDQENPADIIYPSDKNIATISGVKIMDVINGNTILYQSNQPKNTDKCSYKLVKNSG